MDDLKVGDVVRLKSGGPKMTVEDIREGGDIYCCWFDDNAKKGDIFKREILKKTEDRSM